MLYLQGFVLRNGRRQHTRHSFNRIVHNRDVEGAVPYKNTGRLCVFIKSLKTYIFRLYCLFGNFALDAEGLDDLDYSVLSLLRKGL